MCSQARVLAGYPSAIEATLEPDCSRCAGEVVVEGAAEHGQGGDGFLGARDQNQCVAKAGRFAQPLEIALVGRPGFLESDLGLRHANRGRRDLRVGLGNLGGHHVLNAKQLDEPLPLLGAALADQGPVAETQVASWRRRRWGTSGAGFAA